jgi:hypothetical protein
MKVRQRGFALVITLSLMILLTLLAVGLLGLSSVSLRNSAQGEALRTARANARLAMMLAIGQLQRTTGPDQRITMTADQRPKGSDGHQTSAAQGSRHWAGVYRSWPSTATTRPSPEFLGWLVSGAEKQVEDAAFPDTGVTADLGVEMVGEGTLGEMSRDEVLAPALTVTRNGERGGRLAWWVGDQGVKAAVATPKAAVGNDLGVIRHEQQSASRNAVEFAENNGEKPFGGLAAGDERLPRVVSWQAAEFLSTSVSAPQPLFHDLTSSSTGLLTNVTAGGFRKDLSLQLERAVASIPNTPLYTVKSGNVTENGINLPELGIYYNLYKEINRSGSYNFTTSGRLEAKTPHLLVSSSPSLCASDEEFHLKQPAIINYQLVLSFKAIPVMVNGVQKSRLHVVADPIITMWNPLDIPVVVPTGSFITVKYWQVPYDIVVSVNGGTPVRAPLAASLSGATTGDNKDSNFISIQMGSADGPLVFKPGEVVKFSQSGDMIVMTAGVGSKNQLIAKKGFNYGGGFAMPLRNLAGATIDLNPSDRITYEAYPNKLTAGKTSQSGYSVTGANAHTRHFSITHHEVYVGADRGELPNSLGYGGMFIDWDFGNRRLKPGEIRSTSQAGTKPANERLYADRLPLVFKPITSKDARPLSHSQLISTKSPFMMLAYDAKTESGSESGTRTLARFNPRAHFVDFYDLTQSERDILPYEFRVEPLVSWANRSLDLSPDGSGFFGGGLTAQDGTGMVCTHSVPREPVVSLAALQHSFANGFEIHRPVAGYAILNSREPMLPQISHAIGNSMAPSMMDPSKTEGSLPGGRPMADHSFLGNRALWDDWFLSGIAPQASPSYPKAKDQKTLATEFFNGTTKLPIVRYIPDTDGADLNKLLASFFSGSTSTDTGIRTLASYLRVDGLFNVNSTSVEAWKAVLGGLKDRQIVVRDATGRESAGSATTDKVPVTGLAQPVNLVANGTSIDLRDPAQWVGRRELNDDDIEQLAKALVAEIRKRGPFLSLADFVNRRVGRDLKLARAGAVQSALDADTVKINRAFNSGSRSVYSASRFAFPDAEQGPLSYGVPGIIKQGDVLTPIAPILSARSDSFVIRGYGEALDQQGKVTARAWCEAVVERDRRFVNPIDKPEAVVSTLKKANQQFGRRYEIVSFRWLSSDEV